MRAPDTLVPRRVWSGERNQKAFDMCVCPQTFKKASLAYEVQIHFILYIPGACVEEDGQ